MKLILTTLILPFIFLSFTTPGQTGNYVVFSGKINHAINHELVLYDVNNNKTTIKIDDTGRFADTIAVAFMGQYRYFDKKQQLDVYFEKGKNLYLAYDAQDLKNTAVFSGPGAAANNYLLKKAAIRAESRERLMGGKVTNPFELNELAFKEYYLSLKTAMLRELSATPGLSEQYKKLEAGNINYEYLYYLRQYALVQINHLNNKNFKVSKVLSDEWKDLVFTSKEDFQFSGMYRNIVESAYYEKAGEISKAEGTPRDIAHLKVVSTINNAYIRNYLLYKFARSYFNFSTDLKGFYEAFMEGSSDEQDKAEISKMYEAIKGVAAKSTSPKFTNYENYAGGTSSLDDFKGKYVFIDVWATWCGPCIYEFPFLDTLENSYNGKNIQFVTVSIDNKADRQKWRDFVKEKDLDGVQLLADNAFESDFIKAYNINGIPRFLIIDPDGNIVTNNAPRPSDPKLKVLLDSLPL